MLGLSDEERAAEVMFISILKAMIFLMPLSRASLSSLRSFLGEVGKNFSKLSSMLVHSFIVAGYLASKVFSDITQPECNLFPLPSNFSTNPEHWPHSTPLLPNHWREDPPPASRKRDTAKHWNGWSNIEYIFALYVFHVRGIAFSSTYDRTAATHIQVLISLFLALNPIE